MTGQPSNVRLIEWGFPVPRSPGGDHVTDKPKGAQPVGPSKAYLRLLRGEATAKAYADKVKKNVDRQIGRATGRAASG